jgi:N-acetylmuramoyl-L-alanine amidase
MYTVVQGDCLSNIAKMFGFADWRTIYNHANNAAFRKKRPNPNLIYPGDELYIPDENEKTESVGTDSWHNFTLEGQKTLVRLRLLEGDLTPLQGKKYRLEVDGKVKEGTIPGDGLLEQEISADCGEGKLTVWMDNDQTKTGVLWDLKLGHLDPVEENTGVQARLKNLGFDPGPIDGIVGPLTSGALKAFQSKFGLTVTGRADDATKNKLRQVHDNG